MSIDQRVVSAYSSAMAKLKQTMPKTYEMLREKPYLVAKMRSQSGQEFIYIDFQNTMTNDMIYEQYYRVVQQSYAKFNMMFGGD